MFIKRDDGAERGRGAEVSVDPGEMSLTAWTCTEQAMFELLRKRDMHAIGVGSMAGLILLMSLLAWNPYDRQTARKALQSKMFTNMD